MTQRQIEGSIVVVIIVALSYVAVSLLMKYPTPLSEVPFSNGRFGSLIVELAGNTDGKGIYYLPEGATLRELMRRAEIGNNSQAKAGKKELDLILKTGTVVFIDERGSISFKKMDARKKIALYLPLDINQATMEDLLLVPGIGDRMARQIVAHRDKSGSFKKIGDLMKVRGIKAKKFETLRRYLTIEDNGKHR